MRAGGRCVGQVCSLRSPSQDEDGVARYTRAAPWRVTDCQPLRAIVVMPSPIDLMVFENAFCSIEYIWPSACISACAALVSAALSACSFLPASVEASIPLPLALRSLILLLRLIMFFMWSPAAAPMARAMAT